MLAGEPDERLVWITFLVFLLSGSLIAQEAPEFEVFGGYLYFRIPSKFLDNHAYEYTTEPARLKGWSINAVGNLTRWIGVEADFGRIRLMKEELGIEPETC